MALSHRNATYVGEAAAPPLDLMTVLKHGDVNGSKLIDMIDRARRIADAIAGGVPQPAGSSDVASTAGGLIGRLRAHFDAESDALEALSRELRRVENSLGLPITDGAQMVGSNLGG